MCNAKRDACVTVLRAKNVLKSASFADGGVYGKVQDGQRDMMRKSAMWRVGGVRRVARDCVPRVGQFAGG